MPSPFPGMDPYLEHPGWWSDFHAWFIPNCCEALNIVLPDQYDARIDTLAQLIEIPSAEVRSMEPDVFISGTRPIKSSRGPKAKALVALDQVTLRAPKFQRIRQRWIRIFHRREKAVVTIIEILSPTNKSGIGYHKYQVKRGRILARHAHLVEINLLVGGRRPEMDSDWPPGDYYALIARAEQRPRADIKSWSVRDPLPAIPIPLRAPDPDVMLDLAQVFTTTYDRARYARAVDYAEPPFAPLRAADRTWAINRAKAFRAGSSGQSTSPSA